MEPTEFKLGTWVNKVRNHDRNVSQVRSVDAVLDLMKFMPSDKYPSRLDIALALASGEVLSTNHHTYALHLADVVGFEDAPCRGCETIGEEHDRYCKAAAQVAKSQQGHTLTPVVAILTAFCTALVLLGQSGILHSVVARLAEVTR